LDAGRLHIRTAPGLCHEAACGAWDIDIGGWSSNYGCPTKLINNATMAAIAEAILNRALRPVFTSLKQALGPEDAKKSIVSVAGGMYMSPSSEYSSPPSPYTLRRYMPCQ